MNIFWGIIMIVIGALLSISGFLKSESIKYYRGITSILFMQSLEY